MTNEKNVQYIVFNDITYKQSKPFNTFKDAIAYAKRATKRIDASDAETDWNELEAEYIDDDAEQLLSYGPAILAGVDEINISIEKNPVDMYDIFVDGQLFLTDKVAELCYILQKIRTSCFEDELYNKNVVIKNKTGKVVNIEESYIDGTCTTIIKEERQ